jgi:hypothetical protein
MKMLTRAVCPECGLPLELSSFTCPRYAGMLNRLNLLCVLLPFPVTVVLGLLTWLAGRVQSVSEHLGTVSMLLFGLVWMAAPVLGIATLPWRKDYCDARKFSLRKRAVTLFAYLVIGPVLLVLLGI